MTPHEAVLPVPTERGTGVRLVLAEGATVPERAAAARSLDVPEVPVGNTPARARGAARHQR